MNSTTTNNMNQSSTILNGGDSKWDNENDQITMIKDINIQNLPSDNLIKFHQPS